MNLPNKLTCLRMIMIPFFLFFLIFPEVCGFTASRHLAAAIFGATAVTDLLDGHIARKRGLVTDFGKFMDPLADKMMIFGALLGVIVINVKDPRLALSIAFGTTTHAMLFTNIFVWCTFIIIFRELAVTSIRMVVSKAEGIVIAANIFGKIKTLSQSIGLVLIMLEPLFFEWTGMLVVTYVALAIMVFSTIFSGLSYFKAYWPYIDSNK